MPVIMVVAGRFTAVINARFHAADAVAVVK